MLADEEILELLGDGDVSEVGSLSDSEDTEFPSEELDVLLNQFDYNNVEDEALDIPELFSVTNKRDIRYIQKPFKPPVLRLDDLDFSAHNITVMKDPIEYFYEYFDDETFKTIAFNTNLYAVQSGLSRYIPTNADEIKTLIAIHIVMGNLQFPRIRMYWEKKTMIKTVADNMTRNRFFWLRNNLHIIDNNSIPKGNKDKFIKVRPLYDTILKKCTSLPMERNLCVDEMMVPFKGQLSIKQYMKGKPVKWGIKIFLLCGESGIIYNIFLYQGFFELDSNDIKCFGSGGSVVLHLTKNVKSNSHYIFFDNFFSSFGLFEKLQHKQIYAVGTIRTNWFKNPPFMSDKDMRKIGRGTTFEISTDIPNVNISLVKWYDNKPVHLASNFVGSGEVDTVIRWDKKNLKYIEIERPEIVRVYNKSMGGVDRMDQNVSYYRIFIRSRKWTLRMVTHAFDIALCNSWIQYKKDADYMSIPKNKVMDLMKFREEVAEGLIKYKKPPTPKRKGRPPASSNEEEPEKTETVKRKNVDSCVPGDAVRLDGFHHFPIFDDRKYATKCKNKLCTNRRTHIYCSKCEVHLCLDKTSNCFKQFHTKK